MTLILPPVRMPVITLDDLRSLAARLDRNSGRQLLRCLAKFPRRPTVVRWDDEVPYVAEIIITSRSTGRWRLRDHRQGGAWTLKQVGRPSRASLTHQPAGDILLEYQSTYGVLTTLRAHLKSRPGRRRGWSSPEARAELGQLLHESSAGECPLDVNSSLNIVVRESGGKLRPADIPFSRFVSGHFSASSLAKQLVAARYRSSVATLERVLRDARAHHQNSVKEKRQVGSKRRKTSPPQ